MESGTNLDINRFSRRTGIIVFFAPMMAFHPGRIPWQKALSNVWSFLMKAALTRRSLLVLSVLFLLSAACAMPLFEKEPQPTQPAAGNAETQVAQTVAAMMTKVAGESKTQPAPGATTSVPSQPTAAPTVKPANTQQPTAVILPSNTPTPICDMAGFMADVSIADGTNIPVGTQFVKTWRLKNTGTCTWTADYAVVFDGGSGLDAPASQKIGSSVAPGQTIDVSVTMRAPAQTGSYRGNWKMRNASGILFGIGASGEHFYVDIKAVPGSITGSGLDFVANRCLAEWDGNGTILPCDGKDGSDTGFVILQTKPVLEPNYTDDEPALLMNPPAANDGIIRGKYPSYTVKSGDHFKSIIDCEYNAKNCSVRFQLDYTIDNGAIQTFAAWNESYEGNFTKVDVDLTSLAGKNVRFILTVLASGASNGDRAQWLAPRIVNVTTPTP
jgi:hypothetical protein